MSTGSCKAPKRWNHGRLVEAFHARGLELPSSNLVTLSTPLRVHFLGNGPYVSAIAGSLARRNALVELRVDLPRWQFPVSLITLKNRTLTPVVERFIEVTRAEAKLLAKRPQLRPAAE